MSVSTTQAYIVKVNSPDDRPRSPPIFDFLFAHQEAFDHGNMKKEPYTVFHADDFVFTKTDGTVLPPGQASWDGALEGYAPFTEHLHEPRYMNVYEHNGNWEMFGVAMIYGDLPVPGGEKTKVDMSGRKWDVVVPGVFHFVCVQDPSGPKGFKVKSLTIYGDGTPVVGQMIKRGMVKPEDLLK